MRVLIVEDENIAADKLETMLREIDPQVEVLAKTGSIKETARWLSLNQADLIFLDIQLSDGISFSIFEHVAINTPVIFTTAYDQYAIKAFQLNSIAYLLKPIRKADLAESLKKYASLKSAFAIDFDALMAGIQGKKPEYKKRFLIQFGEKIRKIEITEVAYFYVLDKGVNLMTFTGNSYPIDYTLVSKCIYSSPEAASVGMTEDEAKEKGFEVKTGKFSFKAIGKALVYGESDGFVKIVADKETDDILGVHMIGPHVTDMISEAGLAKVLDATPWEVAHTIHPHPTLSEAIGEAALAVDGKAIHS